MGCKSVKGSEVSKTEIVAKLIEFINNNEDKQLDVVLALGKVEIDEVFEEVSGIYFNPLGYAFFKTCPRSFVHLHQYCGASIDRMEKLLISQSIYPLHLLSQKGNLELFAYYVEHSLLNFAVKGPEFSGFNLESGFDRVHNKYALNSVQLLSEFGFVHMLSFVNKHVKGAETAPYEFDFEAVNEVTGENCALIACRHGNYILIKFLKSIGADFKKKNILGENALQILCSANRKKPLKEFYECFVFLVNSAFVEIEYNYEETLLLIDSDRLAVFFEEKLAECGIVTNKKEVEEKYDGKEFECGKEEEESDVKKIRFGTFIRELQQSDTKTSMASLIDRNS